MAQDLSRSGIAELSDIDPVTVLKCNTGHEQCIVGNKRSLIVLVIHRQSARLSEITAVYVIGMVIYLFYGIQDNGFHSHSHDPLRIRHRLTVYILFTVQYIILQCLKVIEIQFILLHALMEVEDRSFMDTDFLEEFRHCLICAYVFSLSLQSQIIPHKVARLVCRTLLQVIVRKSHRGQMIAVEQNNRGFPPVIHIFDQILHEPVHLMNLVRVILPLACLLRCGCARHVDGRFLYHILRGIRAVSLNGYDRHKVLILRRVKRIPDIRDQGLITHPSDLIDLVLITHILVGGEVVETEVRIDRLTAVECSIVVVYGVRRIAEIGKNERSRLTGFFFEHTFIRVFSRSEIPEGHARERFKFRIDCSRPDCRHLIEAGRILA